VQVNHAFTRPGIYLGHIVKLVLVSVKVSNDDKQTPEAVTRRATLVLGLFCLKSSYGLL
jgi:hypothetical protein